ncbi:sortase [Candidatus Saccharibacteria bacterium]|nr:sortase [Candidatus Saccharibacteria bacterium]
MDQKNGGQDSDAELKARQRKTAAEIARKKVLAAYNSDTQNIQKSSTISRNFGVNQQNYQAPISTTASYKQTPINATVTSNKATAEQWQKYHSAWQGYYQKYYSEYYAKAAHDYIETEKLKAERKRRDEENLLRDTGLSGTKPIVSTENPKKKSHLLPGNLANDPSTEEEQGIMESLRQKIREKAVKQTKASRKVRHLIPIIAGVFVVLLILFLQYNRLIFAPIMAYVSPGNSEDSGITALDPTVTTAVGPDNRLIIPKLNVDVPVNFGIPNDTDSINNAMENGVAQFAIPGASAMPGEIGNLVITGHSAGDIYSNNQYKFIFSGLERLNPGDLIYIDYQGTRYTYSVTGSETVEPSNVAALVYDTDKPMLTLITCTPLGTARFRLLVSAEQVNPSPSGAVQSETVDDASTTTEVMPQNEPTFFERIWNFLTGNN